MPDQDICVGESQCLFAAWRTASTVKLSLTLKWGRRLEREGVQKENDKQSYKPGLLCVLT